MLEPIFVPGHALLNPNVAGGVDEVDSERRDGEDKDQSDLEQANYDNFIHSKGGGSMKYNLEYITRYQPTATV